MSNRLRQSDILAENCMRKLDVAEAEREQWENMCKELLEKTRGMNPKV